VVLYLTIYMTTFSEEGPGMRDVYVFESLIFLGDKPNGLNYHKPILCIYTTRELCKL